MARTPSKKSDYKKAERLYRQGLLSNIEIAFECGFKSEGSIRALAKKFGWKHDLTQEVRHQARVKMVENLASYALEGASQGQDSSHDENLIEQAARTQVQVVRDHQTAIKQGHQLTVRMLHELDDVTAFKGELQALITSTVAPQRQEALRRAVTLQARVQTMRDLATAASTWVKLERQAFSIVDETRNPQADRVDDNKTADELRAEILKEAKQLGLDVDLGKDEGVAHSANGKMH